MKKLIAILLALTLVLSMVACGAKEEAPSDTNAPAAAETPAESPAEAPDEGAADAGFDKLDVSLFTGGYGDLWAEMIELFKEKYPNVEVVADLSSDNATRVRARMMTDAPPDVVLINNSDEYDIFQAANSGMLMDLADWFANGVNVDGDPMSEVLPASMLASGTINGAVYLPTWGASYGGWFYNKALFEEHGWEVPETLEEVTALAPKIAEAGIVPLMYQSPGYVTCCIMYQAIAAEGGYKAYEDCFVNLTEGAWTSDTTVAAVTKVDKLVKDGVLSQTSVGADFTQTQLDFVNDRVALIPNGSWFENEMKETTPEGFEMTFMPFPAADKDGCKYITTFNAQIAVSAGAQNPEAAKAFLGVLFSKEGQELVAKYGSMPVISTLSTDDIAEYMTPCTESVLDNVAAGNIQFVSNNPEYWYAAMMPTYLECVDNLVLQDITPEEFCQIMEDTVAAIREDDSIPKYYTN